MWKFPLLNILFCNLGKSFVVNLLCVFLSVNLFVSVLFYHIV